MEKCGQEKFKKLISSMKITPNKLKSLIKETIDELRTVGDTQNAALLGDPNVAGAGALRQAQSIRQQKAEVADLVSGVLCNFYRGFGKLMRPFEVLAVVSLCPNF